jgi:hypothetical protein
MSITLDGQVFFDGQQAEIEVGSFSRASIERAVPELEGIVSIDLGGRGRKIKQSGVLRAKSKAAMDSSIGVISACMDGGVHALTVDGGDVFENVRMDSFKVSDERTSGADVVVDYEIIYTQLQV